MKSKVYFDGTQSPSMYDLAEKEVVGIENRPHERRSGRNKIQVNFLLIFIGLCPVFGSTTVPKLFFHRTEEQISKLHVFTKKTPDLAQVGRPS
jgi:hypothetical protein